MEPDNPYMTVAEAAKYLCLEKETVRRWCNSGRLKATQIGGRCWRIYRATVEEIGPAKSKQDQKLAAWDSALREGYKR